MCAELTLRLAAIEKLNSRYSHLGCARVAACSVAARAVAQRSRLILWSSCVAICSTSALPRKCMPHPWRLSQLSI
jgi:hypothetical protein